MNSNYASLRFQSKVNPLYQKYHKWRLFSYVLESLYYFISISKWIKYIQKNFSHSFRLLGNIKEHIYWIISHFSQAYQNQMMYEKKNQNMDLNVLTYSVCLWLFGAFFSSCFTIRLVFFSSLKPNKRHSLFELDWHEITWWVKVIYVWYLK